MSLYGTPWHAAPPPSDEGGAHRAQEDRTAGPPPALGGAPRAQAEPARPSEPAPDDTGGPGPIWSTGGPGAAQPVLGGPPPAARHATATSQRGTEQTPAPQPVLGAVPASTSTTTRLTGSAVTAEPASQQSTGPARSQSALVAPAPARTQDAPADARTTTPTQEAVAAAQAAAATAAATVATVATAADLAAAGGTVYGGGNPPGANGKLRRTVRPLPRLRIGAHLTSEADLEQMRVAGPGVGMLLGHDRDRSPVLVRLFRPEPTRATLVGGLWASQLTAFRALALGARLVVFTSNPELWNGFGEWATGRSDRVAVLPAERPVTVTAGPRVPALLLYDVGLLGAANRPVLGPWQTQLTVLRQLTAYGFPAVQESNLVVMQRLAAEEAMAAGSMLRLTPQATKLLQVLRDDMLALVGGGADRYVWVSPTHVEQGQFGKPHR
jgi:ESX secretion system protein EccE